MNGVTLSKSLLAGIGLALSLQAPAMAENVKLKFADWLPVSHYAVPQGIEPWMEDVQEQSDNSITFEYYPSQQLGKATDMLTLLQTGVVDVAHLAPAYQSDKFPLSGVGGLPWAAESTCDTTAAKFSLMSEGGVLEELEVRPQGFRVLWTMVFDPYVIATARDEILTPGDLIGLKMRSPGGALDIMATDLGTIPVTMSGPDVLPSLQRGTIDGTFTPLLAIKPFDWQTVLKHLTTNVRLGAGVAAFAISDRAWEMLTEEQRKVLRVTGEAAMQRLCTYIDTAVSSMESELIKDGLTVEQFSETDVAAINEKLAGTRLHWASLLDQQGKAGSETLEAFMQALTD